MSAETEHDDACRCDGCVNVNYPRPRSVVVAELRDICAEHGVEWALEFVQPPQLELFR